MSPFKSQAQRRKFAQLLVEGKISPETYEEWNRETGGARLPERVKREKRSQRRSSASKRSAASRAKKKTGKAGHAGKTRKTTRATRHKTAAKRSRKR